MNDLAEGAATRTRLRRLSTAAAIAAAGICALELSFGLWFVPDGWERALALNVVRQRTVISDAAALYVGGGPIVYSRDRYGLRGDYGEPSDVDILTIGGSTTDQRYLSDGTTWQDELRRVLQARGRDVRVANAGVDGHTTFGHVAAYRHWFPLIPNLRPAYVILYVGLNDFFINGPAIPFEGTTDGSPTLKSRIKADSAFYRLYARAWGAWLARRAGLMHGAVDADILRYTTTPNLRGHEALARARFRDFERRMRTLLDLVGAGNARAICVTEPSIHYRRNSAGTIEGVEMALETIPEGVINGVDFFHLRRWQNTIMLSACRAAGATTIDLAAAEWRGEDFYDLVHATPAGAQRVGRRIADAMSQLPF